MGEVTYRVFSKDPVVLGGILFTILIGGIITKMVYNLYLHPLRDYPGPFFGRVTSLYYIRWNLSGLQHIKEKEWHDRYGEVIRLAPNYLSYNSNQAWKDIAGHRSSYQKGTFDKDQTFFGKPLNGAYNIAAANGDEHRRLRRLLAHAFSDKALKLQEPLLQGYVDKFINQLRQRSTSEGAIDIVKWFNFATFDMIGDLAFGEPFGLLETGKGDRYVDSIYGSVKIGTYIRAVTQVFPSPLKEVFLMLFVPKKLMEDQKHQVQLAEAKLMKRMELDTARDDFISYILKGSRMEIGEKGLSFPEMVSQAQVLILAGSETTATLLSGMTYLLLTNPSTLTKLMAEIRSSFTDQSDITLARAGQLPYLRAVLEEAMRMYPPVPNALPRLTPYPGEVICGKFVPGGVAVGLHHFSTYRSDRNFNEPDSFVPERWLPNHDKRFDGENHEAFHPFSYGPRSCLGRNLAYAELQLIATKLFWNFDLELQAESQKWMEQLTYALWQKASLNVKLTPVNRKA